MIPPNTEYPLSGSATRSAKLPNCGILFFPKAQICEKQAAREGTAYFQLCCCPPASGALGTY